MLRPLLLPPPLLLALRLIMQGLPSLRSLGPALSYYSGSVSQEGTVKTLEFKVRGATTS
jgi:hypothetical protein